MREPQIFPQEGQGNPSVGGMPAFLRCRWARLAVRLCWLLSVMRVTALAHVARQAEWSCARVSSCVRLMAVRFRRSFVALHRAVEDLGEKAVVRHADGVSYPTVGVFGHSCFRTGEYSAAQDL